MPILSVILGLLGNIPEIIKIIREILALVASMKPVEERKDTMKEFGGAYQELRKTGDATRLKALHDQLSPVGQSPDVVTE